MAPDRRRRALLAAGIAAFAGCSTADAPPATDPGTGTSSPTDGSDGPPSVDRVTPTDDAVAWRLSLAEDATRPTVAGGTVYVGVGETASSTPTPGGRSGSHLVAVDARDGTDTWRVALPHPLTDAPTVVGSDAYAVTGFSTGMTGVDQRVRAVGPDGERWAGDPVDEFLQVLAVDENHVYTGRSTDHLRTDGERTTARAREDGRVAWTAETGSGVGGRVVGDTLLVDEAGVAVTALDAVSGEERWRADGGLLPDATGRPLVAGGNCYVETDDGLRALSVVDGADAWAYAPTDVGGEAFVPTGVAAGEDTLVCTEYGGAVVGLDPATGAERWTARVGRRAPEPPVVDDGIAAVSAADGRLHALSTDDGARSWAVGLGGSVVAPAAAVDGRVVARGVRDGYGVVGVVDVASGAVGVRFAPEIGLTPPAVGDGVVAVVGGRSLYGLRL